MLQIVRTIGRYFGFRQLSFDLDGSSMRRLNWINLVPLLVIVALSVQVLAVYQIDGNYFQDPTAWDEALWIADVGIRAGTPLALAIFFAAGMQRWSRSAGTYMVLIGFVLVVAGAGFGVVSIGLIAATGITDAFDLKVQLWTEWSATLPLLAAGYFYVAYRSGLHRRSMRGFARRRYSVPS